jgi:hypothetical protein
MSLHTCCVTVKEDQRLWVFQSRVLRETVGPGRDKVVGKRGRVDSEELHGLCCSPNVIASDQMQENALGIALGMYERKDKWIQDFGQENCRKETTEKT